MKIVVTPKEAITKIENSLLMGHRALNKMSLAFEDDYFLSSSYLPLNNRRLEHDKLIEQYNKWTDNVLKVFDNIFLNSISVKVKFLQFPKKYLNLEKVRNARRERGNKDAIYFLAKIKGLDDQLNLLVSIAEDIERMQKNPIYYLPEKCLIGMYDEFIALGKDSNQDILCAYTLMNRSFGEMIPMEEIWIKGFREKSSNYDSAAIEKITNAAKETNKKTNDVWNFSLFKISKPCLKLNFQTPSLK